MNTICTSPHLGRWAILFGVYLVALTTTTSADGLDIDKVYLPYVQLLENELEYRLVAADGLGNNYQRHKLGVGKSLSDRLFGEVYLTGLGEDGSQLKLEGIELEALYQLTEQGQYSYDWGFLAEYERERDESLNEFSGGVIVSRSWGRWVGTGNLLATYEWGNNVDNEWESSARLQALYRYKPHLEPSLELHLGEETRAAGPLIQGTLRQGFGRQLTWRTGVMLGLDSSTPDYILKAALEYEF